MAVTESFKPFLGLIIFFIGMIALPVYLWWPFIFDTDKKKKEKRDVQ